MLSYYIIAAIAFTLGFLAAAAFTAGRRAQVGREQAWLAEAIRKFTAACRRRPSGENYLASGEELKQLEEAAEEKC